MKFLLYSLFGGLVMLGGILYLWAAGSRAVQDVSTFFRMDTLTQLLPSAPLVIQMVIFVTFMVAFAIKAPMVPVHTWLPDTAAVARPGTSVPGVLPDCSPEDAKSSTSSAIWKATPTFSPKSLTTSATSWPAPDSSAPKEAAVETSEPVLSARTCK